MVFELLQRRYLRIGAFLAAAVAVWCLVPTFGERTAGGSAGTELLALPGFGPINLSGRLVLWADTWVALIGDPQLLGRGLGATERFFSTRFSGLHDVHNSYLSMLADVGVLGLTLLLGSLVGMGVVVLRRRGVDRGGPRYGILCVALLAVILFASATENTFYGYATLPMFLFTSYALFLNSTKASQPLVQECRAGTRYIHGREATRSG